MADKRVTELEEQTRLDKLVLLDYLARGGMKPAQADIFLHEIYMAGYQAGYERAKSEHGDNDIQTE